MPWRDSRTPPSPCHPSLPPLLFVSERLNLGIRPPYPPPPLAGKRNLTASAGRLCFRHRRLSCRDNMLISQPVMLINGRGRRRDVDLAPLWNRGWRTGLSPGKPLLLIHKNAINYDRIRDRTDVPAAVFDRDLAIMREYRSIPEISNSVSRPR